MKLNLPLMQKMIKDTLRHTESQVVTRRLSLKEFIDVLQEREKENGRRNSKTCEKRKKDELSFMMLPK